VAADTTLAGAGELWLKQETPRVLGAAGVKLTVGPEQRVHGFGDVTVAVVNQGLIEADTSGKGLTFWKAVDNAGTVRALNGGSLTVSGVVTNSGALEATGGALDLKSDVLVPNPGLLGGQPTATITMGGSLSGTTRNADRFSPLAKVVLKGAGTATAPQLLEVMSRDIGASLPGFTRSFAYSTLAVEGKTYVRLVDQADNAPGTEPEALYVNSLIVPAGATLDLNGFHLYARAVQSGGTIVGGTIQQIPDSGPIALGMATPGAIGVAGELDEWTFFGRAGRSVTVAVNPGGAGFTPPLPPYLGFAEVQLLDATDTVLAKASSSSDGAIVPLANVGLPADANYRVQVRASAGHQANQGNYTVTVWDITADVAPLLFNQPFVGRIETPYSVDRWTFSANAAQQIRFDLGKVSGASPAFDLTGPDGWIGFSNLVAASGLVTLPASGNYALTAYGTGGQFGGTYAARVEETAQTDLALGAPFKGTFAGSGQAQLFRIALTNSTPLLVTLDDSSTTNHNELYLKLGAPPTRGDYDYRCAKPSSADQQVLVPMAAPGMWYVLVYADCVAAPSDYTLWAAAAPIVLTGVTPNRHDTNTPTTLTLAGAGFDSSTAVHLVAPDGTSYAASLAEADSFTQLTVTLAAGSVPPGRYAVRVNHGDTQSSELADAVEMIAGGRARFSANVIFPSTVGYHTSATLYLDYANVGDLSMPAPLLALTPTQNGRAAALLTLDRSRVTQGYWTTALPEGFANTVQVLASGKVPGLLQPGESGRVPVYWAGWQQPWDLSHPPIQFELVRQTATSTEALDWSAMKAELRPEWASAEAWEVIFANLTNRVGNTWGAYVTMLDGNAAYLGRLGQSVTDIDSLWDFEVQQATGLDTLPTLASTFDLIVPAPGLNLSFNRAYRHATDRRYALGPFGRGWSMAWSTALRVGDDGAVEIVSSSGSVQRFEPDSRTGGYFPPSGEGSALKRLGDHSFLVTEDDGLVTHFGVDGKLDYIEDTNCNRVTAGYTSGHLTSLTHSAGRSIAVFYNAAGLIQSLNDSLGRTVTYSYDAANEHLIAVQDYRGRTTQYSYSSGAGPSSEHALLSIAFPDGTHQYHAYDSAGRLAAVFGDEGAERIEIGYPTAGTLTVTDAIGNQTRTWYDHEGAIAKSEQSSGYSVVRSFDDLHRVARATDSAGRMASFTHDCCGAITGQTDALGQSERLTYSRPPRRMDSSADPRGNTTHYSYDSRGNPIAITDPDRSQKRIMYDTRGNVVSITNRRGETISYVYDSTGAVTRETLPDGQHTDFAYDARGNLTAVTDSGGVTDFEYDSADQLTKLTYPNGRFLVFTYDKGGRRIGMIDHEGFAVAYTYDTAGRLATINNGIGQLFVQYTYDSAGQLVREDRGNGTHATYDYQC
jgi:YD repeat-containing protein